MGSRHSVCYLIFICAGGEKRHSKCLDIDDEGMKFLTKTSELDYYIDILSKYRRNNGMIARRLII